MIKNLELNNFLSNHWQKKPLLIPAAFPEYKPPISAEELAGLACEDFIESRIISEHTENDQSIKSRWQLESGPFAESRFSTLPESHWTLLIQGLNKIIPEFDDLLHEFNFIPNWRVDDVMASFAAPNGSVGPHIDQYDVFLLQATGRRKWMISEKPVTDNDYIEDCALKIIKDFTSQSEWILEAGDMLYLPPNVAHYGIGMDDCMTFSIGFRAPSHAELLSAFVDEHINQLQDDMRYQDPELSSNINNGEITSDAINKVQDILLSQFSDKSKIEDWFGCFITDYLNEDDSLGENTMNSSEFIARFKSSKLLRRPASVRANYLINDNGLLSLFINGEKKEIKSDNADIIKLYCNQHLNHYNDMKNHLNDAHVVEFLCELVNNGYLEFYDE